MRRSKTIPISEAVKDYLREMKFDDKLREVGLVGDWEEIVGKAISSRTEKVYIRDGILYVHLKSSIVRNELLMLREALKEKLNNRAGAEVIREIVLK